MTTMEIYDYKSLSSNATPQEDDNMNNLYENQNLLHSLKDNSQEYRIGAILWTYVCPIIVIFGLCSNILSFLIFCQNPLRHSTFSLYIRVLAVSDTGVLLSLGFYYWIKTVFNIDITSKNAFFCKIWTTFAQMMSAMSGWVLLALAMDRVIGVYWPHRYKHISTKKKASVILTLIVVTMFALSSHRLTNKIVSEPHPWFPNQNITSCKINNNYYMKHIMPWLILCFYTIFPFLFILTCNVSIIYKLMTAAHRRHQHLSSSTQNLNISNVTKILMTISLVYLICTGPFTSFVIYIAMLPTHTLSIEELRTFFLLEAICKLIAAINHATNFIWYCISGSAFRNQLKACCCGRNNSAINITRTTTDSNTVVVVETICD